MAELTELGAYKQLLQVTENILSELSPEDEILKKYYVLKKSVLAKTRPSNNDISFSDALLQAYKNLSKAALECVSEFEAEIEGQMSKDTFCKTTDRLLRQVDKKSKALNEQMTRNQQQHRGIRLMMKEQVNGWKFAVQEWAGKIENMALMIEVHRKMHEIILQASEKEVKTAQKEAEYNRRLNEMEDVVDKIHDVGRFIDAYEMTEKKARKFELARKSLARVLFEL